MADTIASLGIEVTQKGVKEAQESLGKLGVKAGAAEKAVKKYKKETQSNTQAQKQYAAQQQKTTAAVSQAEQVHKSARGGFRAMRGATQQLSFQLQDVAVQAQSGTSAFTILAQQGPQILSVFGPGGAVVGALVAFGALIGGVLVSAMGDAEESIDDLDEALKRLDRTAETTENGVSKLSERIFKLARKSSIAAMAELARSQNTAEQAVQAHRKAIDDLIESEDRFVGDSAFDDTLRHSAELLKNLEAAGNSATDIVAGRLKNELLNHAGVQALGKDLGQLIRSFGVGEESAGKLIKTVGSLDPNDIQTYKDLQTVLDDVLVAEGGDVKDRFFEFSAAISDNVEEIEAYDGKVKLLGKSLEALKESGMGGLIAVGDPQRQIDAQNELIDLLRKEDEERQELLRNNVEIRDKMRSMLQKEVDETERAEQEKQRLQEQTAKHLSTLYSATSPAVLSFARQQQAILAILEESNEKQLLSDEALDRAKKTLQEDLTAFIKEETEKREQAELQSQQRQAEAQARAIYNQMSLMEKWALSTREAMENVEMLQLQMVQSFENNLGGAIEGLLTGTQSFKEAFGNMTKAILQEFLGMVAQMIAQRIAFALFGAKVEKVAALKLAAYQGALSQAKVAEAALNAYVSTLAIPIIGPGLAPKAAATAAGVAEGLAAINTTANIAAAGARATGGQVLGGQTYLVGERGPELLTMGGTGRVASNDQLKQAIGGGESIQIVNNIDARGAGPDVDNKIRQAMKETSAITMANVQDLIRRRRFA